MPLWVILTVTSLTVLLVGLLLAGTVYFVKKYSSTRGDYYTQVSQDTSRKDLISMVELLVHYCAQKGPIRVSFHSRKESIIGRNMMIQSMRAKSLYISK